ncbi:MAG: DNA gyrase inhibitor YacG [Phycisphaerae bacterium]
MTDAQNNIPVRHCPICKKPADLNSEAFPFCSPRCRLVDLNQWMEGRYAVTRPLDPQDIDEGRPDTPEAPGDAGP